MSEELNYYTNYIESDFRDSVAKVVIKIGQEFVEYNLSERSFRML